MKLKLLSFITIIIFLVGCKTEKETYSFFIAGHTYGSPNNKHTHGGLYKPFRDKIDYINGRTDIKLGFLLGDLVWMPKFWDETIQDINKFDMPIHVARGNHDGNLESFEKKFGKSFKKFLYNNDLFIILDPNINHWNIDDKQLTFLRNTLRIDGKKAKHIFVFMHQVIWYTKGIFGENLIPNYFQNRDKNSNYWSVLEPLFQNVSNPVYLFAGDVGAFPKDKKRGGFMYTIQSTYNIDKNITYITSGMGSQNNDSFVIINVTDTRVNFELISLNGDDINSLGKLEDYINPYNLKK